MRTATTRSRLMRTAALIALADAAVDISWLCTRFAIGRLMAPLGPPVQPLPDLGEVSELSITPLVEARAAHPSLVTEYGVSYLLRADDEVLLFDVGLNHRGERNSPLLRNIAALGVDLATIRHVVISHPHFDHVGGLRAGLARTFRLGRHDAPLPAATALLPPGMSRTDLPCVTVTGPQRISTGVATLGPLPRMLFFLGWTPEQALAVNIKNLGLVIITGCGHPGLDAIIDRARRLFDVPVHAVVGGLHYPIHGLRAQALLGTSRWPWRPVRERDVFDGIEALRRADPALIAVSAHDTSDWAIGILADAFPGRVRVLRAGETLRFGRATGAGDPVEQAAPDSRNEDRSSAVAATPSDPRRRHR